MANQKLAQYSTRMPDGRTLAFVPSELPTYTLDDKEVTFAQAEKAWNEQPHSWQRGRTLQQTLDYWQGKV